MIAKDDSFKVQGRSAPAPRDPMLIKLESLGVPVEWASVKTFGRLICMLCQTIWAGVAHKIRTLCHWFFEL